MTQSTKPNVLLHPATKSNLERAAAKNSHSFLLTGSPYVGKFSASKWLAESIVGPQWQSQAIIIEPNEKGNISIDSVHEIRKYTNYKSNSPSDRRVVIVRDAHTMTSDAQNSFLKMLEEPSDDVLLILLAWQPHRLLQTIRSRVQAIDIKPATIDQIVQAYPDMNPATLEKIYLMSGGANVLVQELIEDKEHSYRDEIQEAKRLIGSSPYERLCRLNDYSKDIQATDKTLTAAVQILVTLINSAAKDNKSIKPLLDKVEALFAARESIRKNHNTKLTLTLLFTRL